jgi:glycosyltransferase involved in cell wall biosynthesis
VSAVDGPLRVAHVCCTDAFAGVERHVSELAAAQAAAGHAVLIVGGQQDQMVLAAGPEVTVRPGARIDIALRSLTRLPFRPEVINVHMTAAEVTLAIAPQLRTVPVVSTHHLAAARGSRRRTRVLIRLAARRISAQLAVSDYVAAHIDGASTVVLSGVRPESDRVPALARESTVLVAQRLETEKRTDLALHAFARSGLLETGWRLQIVGDGSLRPELERLARALRIVSVVDFLGHRSDVHELMNAAGMLLATGPHEAFGLSVVEAMARGLPIVASRSGAHLETVGSTPGAALFTVGDAADAARLLGDLAGDAQRRDAYGAALQDAQRRRFTVERQSRDTDAVYRSVL